MPFGAELTAGGEVRFRLWAPNWEQIHLHIDGRPRALPMKALESGWHELVTGQARVGTRYHYALADGLKVPDPASRFQPEDIHGPSEVIDPTVFRWSDDAWTGRPWEECVFYEMHVGTFTAEGTFRAAIAKLDHLVRLGVTVLELLPFADFPGQRNWGYDGVQLFAPDSSYGHPEDLKALVDAAHAKGLMVFMDVVYNHFGPEGNYLPTYAPSFFTERHKTPWGAAINYDGPDSRPVRDFAIHNALYWIEEFHMDGLRLDAVHAIMDDSPKHVLEELAERVQASVGGRRQVHLVLENASNQARFLTRAEDGGARWYAGQWNDDLHHGLHVAATGEGNGYYAQYARDRRLLPRSLAEGYAFQGEHFEPTNSPRGEPSAHLAPTAFISFLQNHDQVGNRAFGERIAAIAKTEPVRAAAAAYLLAPQIPMLFMGEEWGALQPFPFFCDFGEDLAGAVRNGRREEFAGFPEFEDPEARARIPDAIAPDTYAMAKLDWADLEKASHAEWMDWYRRILEVRRREIVPRLLGAPGGTGRYDLVGQSGTGVRWTLGDGSTLRFQANFGREPLTGIEVPAGRVIWTEGFGHDGQHLGPWSVVWSIETTT